MKISLQILSEGIRDESENYPFLILLFSFSLNESHLKKKKAKNSWAQKTMRFGSENGPNDEHPSVIFVLAISSETLPALLLQQ